MMGNDSQFFARSFIDNYGKSGVFQILHTLFMKMGRQSIFYNAISFSAFAF